MFSAGMFPGKRCFCLFFEGTAPTTSTTRHLVLFIMRVCCRDHIGVLAGAILVWLSAFEKPAC